jgi:hypothetical protein
MIESTVLQGLQRLKKNLATEPQTLDELWQSRPIVWQELGWKKEQLKLWLRCQPDIKKNVHQTKSDNYEMTGDETDSTLDIGEIIAKVLQGTGKPVPLANLKNKLPSNLVVTTPMLKAAINDHPNLQMIGPLVKLN